jgi:hypothetical protein
MNVNKNDGCSLQRNIKVIFIDSMSACHVEKWMEAASPPIWAENKLQIIYYLAYLKIYCYLPFLHFYRVWHQQPENAEVPSRSHTNNHTNYLLFQHCFRAFELITHSVPTEVFVIRSTQIQCHAIQ